MSPEFSMEVSRKPPFSMFMSTYAMWTRGRHGETGWWKEPVLECHGHGLVTELSFGCSLLKSPMPDKCYIRKDSFIEEASNPREKVDSYPKEPTPHSPSFCLEII